MRALLPLTAALCPTGCLENGFPPKASVRRRDSHLKISEGDCLLQRKVPGRSADPDDIFPGRQFPRIRCFIKNAQAIFADRNTHLWSKVETDAGYREMARSIWRQDFQPSDDDPPPEEARKTEKEQIERMARAVAKLRARAVKVLFVRMPSSGEYLAFENRDFPRARTWDALLAATAAPGIHFEDYPELQGYYLPEWSHMTRAEAERFTAALYRLIARDFWGSSAAATAATAVAAEHGSR